MILTALLLDLLFGDPPDKYHPVAYIGRLIGFLERFFNKRSFLRLKGMILVLLVVFFAYLFSYWMVVAAKGINPILGFFVSAVIVWFSISVKNLGLSAMKVSLAVLDGNLAEARRLVGRIVGRDTQAMSESEVCRAAVESVSENLVDGVIAPLFYALIGGAPLAFAYRALNTVDSMVGYKSEKFKEFGWAGARLDDAANYVPARLGVAFVAAAAAFGGIRPLTVFRTAQIYGANHASPNSGVAEAAAAGALGLRLGGPSTYSGREVFYGYIGEGRAPTQEDISESVRLMKTSSLIAALLFTFALLVLEIFKR